MKTNYRKTIKAIILASFLPLAGLLAVPATAQVNYVVSGSTAFVTSSPNATGNIVIASTYNGFPVVNIGQGAFSGCTGLTGATIPESVRMILTSAFSGCTRLTSVTIPNSVIRLDAETFSGCTSLTNIAVAIDNPAFTSANGVLFNKAQTQLLTFPGGRDGDYAIPSGVTYIARAAFDHCTRLTNVIIPDTVGAIDFHAFSGCISLVSVTIPNSVTNIASPVLNDCTSLTNITVGMDNPSFSSSNGVLLNKAQTALIQFPGGRGGAYAIPNGVAYIYPYAFSSCSNLTSVTIPNGLIGIYFDAFSGCTGLTSVTIPDGVTVIDVEAFSDCTGLTSVTIPNTVTSIGLKAFYRCTGLTNVIIGSSVTTIQDSAFGGCRSLLSVTIPNNVTNIQSGAFLGCTSLTNFTVAGANSTYSSLEGVLFNKAQTLLIQFPNGRGGPYVIPNSVTFVAVLAFYNCVNLTSVTIPNTVTNIAGTFVNCPNLTNFSVNAANSVYSSLNGVLFNKSQTALIEFPPGLGGSYVIPNTVTAIPAIAFYQCANLMSVTIPNSVASIGFHAFYSCSSLTNLTFLGNAPIAYDTPFYNSAAGARVYYYYGATGWGPTYGGVPAVMLGAPAPQVGTATAGVTPGGYGFTISGVTNQTIVIEASTNLVNWQPIWTTTLSAVSTSFVDPEWLNFPHRFYRARSN